MQLTVVLTNYLRPEIVKQILIASGSQTAQHQLFVWDNSPDNSFPQDQADWVVKSSRNAKCSARWWLASQADTPWVIVMDDDLSPTDDHVLSDTLAILEKYQPQIVGATGVILEPSKSYFKCRHVGCKAKSILSDTPVDIVKGRFFAVAKQRLMTLPFIPLESEDDIIVSASLGRGIVPYSLQFRFRELSIGTEARFRRPEHRLAREITRRKYWSEAT